MSCSITTVDSTTLAAIAHDGLAQTLWLQFRRGARYLYYGVPATVEQGLLSASSKGQYFNRHIRGRFPYRRIETLLPGS